MILSTAGRLLRNSVITMVISAIAVALSGCDSLIYDGEGDCSVHYRLSFRYSKNILNADAFASQVTDVTVAVYDKQGRMVCRRTESRQPTTDNNFYIEVDLLPGTYDIIAWCQGRSIVEDAISFALQGQDAGDAITSSGAVLPVGGTTGNPVVNNDINRLYYGMLTDVEFPDTYGTVDIEPIQLIKDTNHITVQLQNMDGKPLDPEAVVFELEGANSSLNWQNALTGSQRFTYRPWSVISTTSSITSALAGSRVVADEVPSGLQAEFTTGRIMADVPQQMTIRQRSSGETILTFPLVKYLLLVRGYYEQATSDQDYLDRYDDFTMVFFVDEGYTWINSRIYINGWRIVPPQDEHL